MHRLTLVAVDLAVLLLVARAARAGDEDGSKPIYRSTAEIMRLAPTPERPRPFHDRAIKREPDRSRLPGNPESPAVSRVGGTAAAPETGWPLGPPRAPQTVSAPNFTSVTTDDAPFVPPDTMGAVGPTNFLTAVNGRIRAHTKTTGAVGALDADDSVFWTPVIEDPADPLEFVSYPRVRFDRLTDRWFLTILDIPSDVGANGSRILIAMSDGPDIGASTSWKYFFFDQDLASPTGDAGCLSNYPTLGIDVSALYIGANIYCGPTLSFSNTSAWVVRKSTLLNPATPANLTLTPGAVKAFRDLLDPVFPNAGIFAPQGVDNYDPGATKGRFIGVDYASFGTLVLRDVNNPGSGSPTLSPHTLLTVPATRFPMDVATPGGGRPLDGLDDRLLAAHLRAGRIWTAQQIQVDSGGVASDTGNRNGVRWYQIDVSGAPTLIQTGTVFDASAVDPLSYWMGTVMVSGQGHAALGFTAASPTVQPAAATVGRLASDALGTTQGPPVVYHAGEADYVDISSGPPARWGDYSMTTLDPCDDMTMWTTQEFSATPVLFSVNWGARVVRLQAPPPATPVTAVPSRVAIGQASVGVTITGSTAGGAGFYDTPSTGMSACRTRIAGLVGNGVTVNSITLVNANTVTLDLNTQVATPGPAVVTITNPDGQSALGSILTIPPATGAIVFGTKTVSGVLASGGAITYTVTLTNSGLTQADNPGDELSDILPSSLTLVSAGATSGTAFADLGANTVHWNGPLPASGSVTITIQATVNASTPIDTMVSNQGTINYDSDGNGTNETPTLTDDPGAPGSANPTAFVVGAAYYTVSPCRVLDTRNPAGSYGGPALVAGADRTFTVGGQCSVPASAKAVSVNLAVTEPTVTGNLRLYPAGTPLPLIASINYAAGQTRSNNAVVPLNALGEIAVRCAQASGTAHFILDVNGYFQ